MADEKISQLADAGAPQDTDQLVVARTGTTLSLLWSSVKTALNSLYAPLTRTLTAGTGLTGGGDLSADRSFAVSYGTTAGTAAQGNDSRLSDARTPTGTAGGDLTGTYPNPTLGTSGVSAATYGDSTHVAQVTIDAKGRVTAASNVSLSGGMVVLFDSTLGSPASTIDTGANGIASGHGDLILELVLRASAAVVSFNVGVQFNGDTGGNYDWTGMRNNAGTLSATGANAASSAVFAQAPGSSAGANYPSAITVRIPSYDQTTFFKAGTSLTGPSLSTSATIAFDSFAWRNTAAINQITVLAGSGTTFIAGSRMVVYGTK